MEIRLLEDKFNSDQLYEDFLADSISFEAEYVSKKSVYIQKAVPFPIYIATKNINQKKTDFKEAIRIIQSDYLNLDRGIHLDGNFWHSLLVFYCRDYILINYPEVKESKKKFDNIVLKKFDWENYIYKCVLAAEYVSDSNFETKEDEEKFIDLIVDNLDLYNYIIKYPLFRNRQFIINFLMIIEENKWGKILKRKIKNSTGSSEDNRYSRKIFLELNKNYPIIMSPFLEKEELKEEIIKAASLYNLNLLALDDQKENCNE